MEVEEIKEKLLVTSKNTLQLVDYLLVNINQYIHLKINILQAIINLFENISETLLLISNHWLLIKNLYYQEYKVVIDSLLEQIMARRDPYHTVFKTLNYDFNYLESFNLTSSLDLSCLGLIARNDQNAIQKIIEFNPSGSKFQIKNQKKLKKIIMSCLKKHQIDNVEIDHAARNLEARNKILDVGVFDLDLSLVIDIVLNTLRLRDPILFDNDVMKYINENISQMEQNQQVEDQSQNEVPNDQVQQDEIIEQDLDLSSILKPKELTTTQTESIFNLTINRLILNTNPKDVGKMVLVTRMGCRSKIGLKEILNSLFTDLKANFDWILLFMYELYQSNDQYNDKSGSPTRYEQWTEKLFEELKKLDAQDRLFSKYCVEIPHLDLRFVRECIEDEGARMQLGIATFRDLVMFRPALRDRSLDVLLNLVSFIDILKPL